MSIKKNEYHIALAGNPNVGKSTIFNSLTGLKQHTGNWTGKTVTSKEGGFEFQNSKYIISDLPGTYSLNPSSKEEEVASDFIHYGKYDAVVIVCDAVCLERNLNLVLQILEVTPNVIVCVNLMDEARKKKIHIDLVELSNILKVPVIGTSARTKEGLKKLLLEISNTVLTKKEETLIIEYHGLEDIICKLLTRDYLNRWEVIKLLCGDYQVRNSFKYDPDLIEEIKSILDKNKLETKDIISLVSSTIQNRSNEISKKVIEFKNKDYQKRDRVIDNLFTNKITGFPIMILLLMLIFWITIIGSNYPSEWLSKNLFSFESVLSSFFTYIRLPEWLNSMLVYGLYKTLAWVISVMLPPMAIFFPLFSLLEEFGYLPRIAFNIDRCFQKCGSCGKQALTMCMGFGCNAVGVTGSRIIDSKRERLIAILTNCFVPCNGKFPTMIVLITIFFTKLNKGPLEALYQSLILALIILFGIFMTFVTSKILSKTILKGEPSSFILELPPYRKPQILKIIGKSIIEKTIFILARAAFISAPAGVIIWILANTSYDGINILNHMATFLNHAATLFGLDGVIFLAFILGFPANEIILPIMIMIYESSTSLSNYNSLGDLKDLFITNNWTILTAVCVIIFLLLHFPCSTTCLTIKKETGSFKWTFLAFIIPTIIGLSLCFIITTLVRLIGIF